jgi:IS30 family transposase
MGVPTRELADAFGTSHISINRLVAETGGIRPAKWKDPDRFLTLEERFRMKELLVEKVSLRTIAAALGRAPSTISRELKRASTSGSRADYRPLGGHRRAVEKRRRPKPLKIASNPDLLAAVQEGLDEKFSPEQIVGRLRREHPDDPAWHVSHETIYKTIYLQARGGLKRDLAALTRTGRTLRRVQRRPDERRGRLKDMVSIWDRPIEALDRAVPGHWEGDLIVGKDGGSAIGTIVERHSNYLILVRLDPSKNRVEATRDGLISELADLPLTLKRSLTWDQGREMAQHKDVTIATGIDIFFADPHAPWQRATNENTNGLLRQYFPKGTDLSGFTQTDLDYVADQMNRRPRKRLEFATPYEVLSEHMLQ